MTACLQWSAVLSHSKLKMKTQNIGNAITQEAQIFQDALTALNSEDLRLAETKVFELIAKDSKNIDALYLGAIIAHRSNVPKLALARLQHGLALNPSHFEMLNLLGLVQQDSHDSVRAEKAFRASLSVKPDYAAARRNLAFLLLNSAQPDLAYDAFCELSPQDQTVPTIALAKATCLKDCHRLPEALEALETLESDHSTRHDFLRGQILTGQMQYDPAIQAYESLFTDPVQGPQAIQNAAQIYAMTGQWKKGKKYFLKLSKSAAPDVCAVIADINIKAGDLSAARKLLKSALKMHGKHPALLKTNSEISLLQGEVRDAYIAAKEALTAMPGQLDYMAQFSRAALAAGEFEDALIAAQSALKMVPNDQFWIAMLATGGRAKGQNYQYYYDYPTMVRAYDLSPPTGYDTIEDFNTALSKALSELHIFRSAPLDQSLRLGTQTEFDLRFADNPVIDAFFQSIDSAVQAYMAAIGTATTHPIGRRNSGNYRIAGAWSVKLTKGGFHVNHVHPQGWLSSSYYVEVPPEVAASNDKSGWIQFGQPPTEISDMTAEHFVEPKAGRLVLFPSYMWHGTVPIKGKAARLTLPFDIIPA